MAHGELNRPVMKLAPVLYDGVSEIENRAGDVGATSNQLKSHQTARNNLWNWKNFLQVGTEILYLWYIGSAEILEQPQHRKNYN